MPVGNVYSVEDVPDLVGYINRNKRVFTRLSNQPKSVLLWKDGAPLSEHNLVLKCTKPIKDGGRSGS